MAFSQKTPYYNRPIQDGLRGHFVLRAIGPHAAASGGPQGARARAEPAAPGLRHRSMSPLCHAWGRRSERHAVDQQLFHHRRREQCLMPS